MRSFASEGDESLFKAPVEPFHQAIRLGMVRGGHDVFDSPNSSKLLKYGGLELGASVGRDGGGDSELLDPTMSYRVNYRLRSAVDDGNGYGPPCKSVDCS